MLNPRKFPTPDGPELDKFDPISSVFYWLKSGNRDITHEKPKKAITAATVSDPSSAETELVGRETLNKLKDVVKLLGGKEIAVQKIKEFKSSNQCYLM